MSSHVVDEEIATRFFVSRGNTKIRRGALKGQLLPYSIAASNVGMVFGRYEPVIQKLLVEEVVGCDVAYDIGAHVGSLHSCCRAQLGNKALLLLLSHPKVRQAALKSLSAVMV